MTLLERLRRRYTGSVAEDEALELRHRSDALGVVPIAEAQDRSYVEVSGVARNLTHPPATAGPLSLTVQLYDGSGNVDIVWLGRRSIPGIHPGVHLHVRGRISTPGGVRTMFNPRYEIIPG